MNQNIENQIKYRTVEAFHNCEVFSLRFFHFHCHLSQLTLIRAAFN